MSRQPSYYEYNKNLLENFKEGLTIPSYCQYMGKSLALAMLDHVVTKKFLSQSYAIAEMRWLGMDELTNKEHTLGFFNANRIKIKVWLEHVARRGGGVGGEAMKYAADNLAPFFNSSITSEDLNKTIIEGDKKHPKYEKVAEASTKLVAITLANGFNEFINNSKQEDEK